jgi:DNA-binding response OmpR family regulator
MAPPSGAKLEGMVSSGGAPGEPHPSGRTRVLIVDDQEVLRTLLSRYMTREGFEPVEAEDGKAAIDLYRSVNPTVVLSDIVMPGIDGLGVLREIRAMDPAAAVILMTGYGNEEILLEALRGGAVNFFKKPFDFHEVLSVVGSVARQRLAPDPTPFHSAHLVEETKRFEFTAADTQIQPMINQIALHLGAVAETSDIIHLKIGIEEMIRNAVEHGHLGITGEEKHRALEDGVFGELVRRRLQSGDNAARKIALSSRLSADELVVTIADQGEGFDWRSLPAVSAESFSRYNGRGILLTRIYFDEVRYNDRGNEVTLRKRRRPRA